MSEVFIIYGTTGEYSDRSEWAVAVVESESDAKTFVTALKQQYQQIPQSMHDDRWENEDRMKAIMTLDPYFSTDYTGTNYFYGSAEFVPPALVASKIAA